MNSSCGRNQETMFRLRREDRRNCVDCHQPGVTERVLELLRIELLAALQQCGVKSLREITPAFVRRAT